MDIERLEEISEALVAAAGRGDLDEAATLIAHRAALIQELGALSDHTLVDRLERIRSAGDRAAAMLRSQRGRDLMCFERMRQVAATNASPLANAKVNCVG